MAGAMLGVRRDGQGRACSAGLCVEARGCDFSSLQGSAEQAPASPAASSGVRQLHAQRKPGTVDACLLNGSYYL